jgi:hypothetical protein
MIKDMGGNSLYFSSKHHFGLHKHLIPIQELVFKIGGWVFNRLVNWSLIGWWDGL